MAIQKIAVIGAGAMGTGIAQISAQSGYDVILYDIAEPMLQKSKANIEKGIAKLVQKGKMSAETGDEVMERLSFTTVLETVKDVDLVIEAVIENLKVKQDVFKNLSALCDAHTIFATNTSTMSITKIAAVTDRGNQFAGLHFFNPATIMRLVEIIRGYYTDDATVEALQTYVASLGKESIEVKKDSPGFVVNRLMLPQFREAYLVYDEGIASLEDIDKALKLGLNHPMGPFELMDYTGLDIAFDSFEYLYSEFALPNWAPPTALRRMINANRLGKKTGKGWYDYE
ncbi:3-hydroxyacyl-CoA dehydrogenase family protein [Fusibacter paucivorans]|uniref:3-hydroxyacyl-CoA dehydrogenase family protein n=1 Tax=Fusibacter paucivorans TaxID=76009 RepID=A0ABS5PQR8_9FIRM|nr:3-hydroxyacyl-CoA dehydrogenase family protein [Fusibacter paucivorans]MBS7526731.1 3-hydroxyacyl-CoA dehydrogenase family protein [Fusibacter paucivorans]